MAANTEPEGAVGGEKRASGGDKEAYTFFWKAESPFSQWHPAKFTVDGVLYNCAEQYMMHQKALLFGDEKMAEKIMKSDSPRQQKSCGRKVANFDADEWDAKCRDVVKKANMTKFSQNRRLKPLLLATAGTELAEASPVDTVWGIGLAADNRKARSKKTWRGKNWLGIALTEVREELLKAEQTATSESDSADEDKTS